VPERFYSPTPNRHSSGRKTGTQAKALGGSTWFCSVKAIHRGTMELKKRVSNRRSRMRSAVPENATAQDPETTKTRTAAEPSNAVPWFHFCPLANTGQRMATRLAGERGTKFLPFNKRQPKTAALGQMTRPMMFTKYAQLFCETKFYLQNLLQIIAGFIHWRSKPERMDGSRKKKENADFSLAINSGTVRNSSAPAREEGPGTSNLAQHSADRASRISASPGRSSNFPAALTTARRQGFPQRDRRTTQPCWTDQNWQGRTNLPSFEHATASWDGSNARTKGQDQSRKSWPAAA